MCELNKRIDDLCENFANSAMEKEFLETGIKNILSDIYQDNIDKKKLQETIWSLRDAIKKTEFIDDAYAFEQWRSKALNL